MGEEWGKSEEGMEKGMTDRVWGFARIVIALCSFIFGAS